MKFTWFNLMPWPHLPDDFREKHRTVWVVIDSKLFDPVKSHEVYNTYLDLLEYAAGLEFDAIGANIELSDPAFLQTFLVRNTRQLGAAGKILFPISERGLASRLYRIRAKTLLIWGESDRLVPPVYALALQSALPRADVVMIPEAAHMVAFEKTAKRFMRRIATKAFAGRGECAA
jgi:pimeloyl-ACP methyl ester carboxylesterase